MSNHAHLLLLCMSNHAHLLLLCMSNHAHLLLLCRSSHAHLLLLCGYINEWEKLIDFRQYFSRLLMLRLLKLPSQCYSNEPGNLGNLGSRKKYSLDHKLMVSSIRIP